MNDYLQFNERVVQAILAGITVAMATIPEEIPVVLTVFLAMGAWGLTKKKTLTKNINAIETLGSINVLCVDKTGTITKNKMVVNDVYIDDDEFYEVAVLACQKFPFDPMEIAIQEFCFSNNVDKKIYNNELIYEYAFDTKRKIMGQAWNFKDRKKLFIKGACESILPLCNLDCDKYNEIISKINEYTSCGYRVLTLAKSLILENIPKDILDNKMNFVGLIALSDPPREGIKKSVLSCYDAGIRVIMITGDSGETASSIARDIGIVNYDTVVTGDELEKMPDNELRKIVKETNIFSRVYPDSKMRIVEVLQENNLTVAMTGDGINDATALKRADIGIAMGKRGTNIAKESADIILMDDNFNTIVSAIKNGRLIYDNIKKAISYILIIHIPIALGAIIPPLLKLPNILMPIHIVLLELIIDPTSSIIFQRIKADKNIMKRNPREINESLISFRNIILCILQGIFIFIGFFGSYYYIYVTKNNYELAVTFAFTTLILANFFLVYVLQSNDFSFKNMISSFNDKIIVFINSLIMLILIVIIYIPFFNGLVNMVPLSLFNWVLIIVISLLSTIVFDFFKLKNK